MKWELVDRARAGDHDAFSWLARDAFGRLYGLAMLTLRDADAAQDAVQEALLLAWRNVRSVRDPGAWDTWLYRLTIRTCYRIARTRRQRAVVELQVPPESDGAGTDFTGAIAERDRIGRALATLPLEQRIVMVLHFYLDLPLTEVAVTLDIPAGTAKSRLHRGLETLRTSMTADAEGITMAMRGQPV